MNQVEQVYYSSIAVLQKASTRFGFLPYGVDSKALKKNQMLHSRDALFCALVALVLDDTQLRNTGIQTIQTIADHVDDIGHVSAYIDIEKNRALHGMPAIQDVGIWWLIVFWVYIQQLSDTALKSRYYAHFQEIIQYYQHHLFEGLVEQGEGADWADGMPRSGLVLYTNAVWLLFLKKIQSSEYTTIRSNADFFFATSGITQKEYHHIYRQFPHLRSSIMAAKPVKNTFIAGVSRHSLYSEFDVFGHALLLILGDMKNEQKNSSIGSILQVAENSPRLIRSVQEPIRVGTGAQSAEMINRAWHYQNAGSWPSIGGFVIYALAKNNYIREAADLLQRLADELSSEGHPSYLWAHGRTGKIMGDANATVTAALYCLAYHAVHETAEPL